MASASPACQMPVALTCPRDEHGRLVVAVGRATLPEPPSGQHARYAVPRVVPHALAAESSLLIEKVFEQIERPGARAALNTSNHAGRSSHRPLRRRADRGRRYRCGSSRDEQH
eukprot:5998528-Prymnesium_polylepis.1